MTPLESKVWPSKNLRLFSIFPSINCIVSFLWASNLRSQWLQASWTAKPKSHCLILSTGLNTEKTVITICWMSECRVCVSTQDGVLVLGSFHGLTTQQCLFLSPYLPSSSSLSTAISVPCLQAFLMYTLSFEFFSPACTCLCSRRSPHTEDSIAPLFSEDSEWRTLLPYFFPPLYQR